MSPPKVTAICFDLDGTLADTAPDLGAALNHVLSIANKPAISYQQIRPYAAFGSAKLIELGFGKNHPKEEFYKNILLDYYVANIAVHTKLFSGFNNVLKTLMQKNIKIAIVTNKPERFTKPLTIALGLDKICEVIISGDSANHPKPDPAPINLACNKLNIKPEQAIFVGDSIVDIQAANAAKMPILFAKYGYTEPDDCYFNHWQLFGTIDKPEDILNFL